MHSTERFIQRILLSLVHSFAARPACAPENIPLGSLKRILVVRQHDQLGDLLISTPAIRALRLKFPDAFIGVVVRDYTRPMMENNPNINQLLVFHDKLKNWSWSELKRFWHELRKDGGYDCAVVLNTVSRSFSSDLIALASRARYIVGPDHLSRDSSRPEKIYNVPAHRDAAKKTEIEHNLDVVRVLGAVPDTLEYELVPTNEERIEAENIFLSLGIPKSKLVVGVHFGTLAVPRRYPLEKLAQVIDAVIDRYGAEVVLIVGPNEIEKRKYLLSLLKHGTYSAPVMPLRVTAAFLKHLDLFVGNDTGTLHIASSQRIPTVAFYGPNDPAIWKPPHTRHFAVYAEDKNISGISVAQTLEVIEQAVDYITVHRNTEQR
jgi:ADP-heptose:LPS heptosyltransferase